MRLARGRPTRSKPRSRGTTPSWGTALLAALVASLALGRPVAAQDGGPALLVDSFRTTLGENWIWGKNLGLGFVVLDPVGDSERLESRGSFAIFFKTLDDTTTDGFPGGSNGLYFSASYGGELSLFDPQEARFNPMVGVAAGLVGEPASLGFAPILMGGVRYNSRGADPLGIVFEVQYWLGSGAPRTEFSFTIEDIPRSSLGFSAIPR